MRNVDSLRYAGFWSRLGSMLLDGLIVIVAVLPSIVLGSNHRLSRVYWFIPNVAFGFFYCVYLVKRFGGTPGKLIVGIRIRKLDGEPVGYREAFLRYFPDAILGLLLAIILIIPVFHMTDEEFRSFPPKERNLRIAKLASPLKEPLGIAQQVWLWGELIVLLTNQKRRALHDFIAGTVVVHAQPSQPPIIT